MNFKDPYIKSFLFCGNIRWYEFPVGVVIVTLMVVAGVYLGWRIFHMPEIEEMTGDVPFYIASNGARIDQIPEAKNTAITVCLV